MEHRWEEVRTDAFLFAVSKRMAHADAEDLAQEVCVRLLTVARRAAADPSTALVTKLARAQFVNWVRSTRAAARNVRMVPIEDLSRLQAPLPAEGRRNDVQHRVFLRAAAAVGFRSAQLRLLSQLLAILGMGGSISAVSRVTGIAKPRLRNFLRRVAQALHLIQTAEDGGETTRVTGRTQPEKRAKLSPTQTASG